MEDEQYFESRSMATFACNNNNNDNEVKDRVWKQESQRVCVQRRSRKQSVSGTERIGDRIRQAAVVLRHKSLFECLSMTRVCSSLVEDRMLTTGWDLLRV